LFSISVGEVVFEPDSRIQANFSNPQNGGYTIYPTNVSTATIYPWLAEYGVWFTRSASAFHRGATWGGDGHLSTSTSSASLPSYVVPQMAVLSNLIFPEVLVLTLSSVGAAALFIYTFANFGFQSAFPVLGTVAAAILGIASIRWLSKMVME
jgi:hypothetical protein